MVRQLLDLAAIDYEAAAAEPLDPAALMADIAQAAYLQAAAARVHLVIAGRDLPVLHGPRVLIHSALRNLVENAIQHSPPDGTVRLSAEVRSGGLRFIISDKVPGILPQDHARVTERFWRGAPPTGQGERAGSLDYCRRRGANGGGHLEMGQPDRGQTIWIDLPDTRKVS